MLVEPQPEKCVQSILRRPTIAFDAGPRGRRTNLLAPAVAGTLQTAVPRGLPWLDLTLVRERGEGGAAVAVQPAAQLSVTVDH
jgi:hypothetical protein